MLAEWIRRQSSSLCKSIAAQVLQELKGHERGVPKEAQILLQLKYRDLQRTGGPLPTFDEVRMKSFSQSGEDGVLLYIFSLIGTTNRRCVEICAGNGIECNSANLIVHHDWHGLLVDGSEDNVALGMKFYAAHCINVYTQPVFIAAWITADSVNNLVKHRGFEGPIDLLTIDIDGNDYWVWEALDVVSPRVVVAEFQHVWGAEHAVTQTYDPNFVWRPNALPLGMCGASLPALVTLGRRKGYRLVGIHSCNAFFVRDDLGVDVLPEVPAEACLNGPRHVFARSRLSRYEQEHGSLIGKGWVEVEPDQS